MTPDQALKNFMHKLTNFEHSEIYNYPNVYFVGQGARKKTPSSHNAANNNDGYDDEQGTYLLVAHDHIAYRYEIIKVIGEQTGLRPQNHSDSGKGSFGQVVKAFDHKTQSHVALKIVRNEKRFHRQAQEEIAILEALRRQVRKKKKSTFLNLQDRDNNMNLVHMLESFCFRNHVCMTFELLSMNLYELIKKNRFQVCCHIGFHFPSSNYVQGFSLQLVRKFAHSILQCLEVLSRNKIIHCDLKPENILLKQQGRSGLKVVELYLNLFFTSRQGYRFWLIML